MKPVDTNSVDIAIAGGGPVGLALACMLGDTVILGVNEIDRDADGDVAAQDTYVDPTEPPPAPFEAVTRANIVPATGEPTVQCTATRPPPPAPPLLVLAAVVDAPPFARTTPRNDTIVPTRIYTEPPAPEPAFL